MNPITNQRRLQRPGMPILSLLLGLSLHFTSNADVAPIPGQQPVAPAAGTTEQKARPAPKPAAKSTLARTAETSQTRKKTRPAKRTNEPARMRDAVEQVAQDRAVEKRAQKLRDLLAAAQLDYSEGRLFEPVDTNAATRYKEVLMIDPSQADARIGLQRIADILAAEAEHVALAGDAPRMLQYILQIRDLQPQHPSLQGLDARYKALLANPVVLSARQKDRYSRSAQSIDAAYSVLKNRPAGLQSIDEVVDEYDRAARLVQQAPGLPKLKDRINVAFPAAVRAELANDEPRRALSVVQMARRRGWYTDELAPLEEQARNDIKAKGWIPSSVQQRQ